MKRRGFFGALIGLCLAPLAAKRKPVDKAPLGIKADSVRFPSWKRGVSASRTETERKLLQAVKQIEDDFWRPPTDRKEPFGISFWLKS